MCLFFCNSKTFLKFFDHFLNLIHTWKSRGCRTVPLLIALILHTGIKQERYAEPLPMNLVQKIRWTIFHCTSTSSWNFLFFVHPSTFFKQYFRHLLSGLLGAFQVQRCNVTGSTSKSLGADADVEDWGLLFWNWNGEVVASYPGLSMFFNVHEKNWEGLVDFGDVMDVVCDEAHWNEWSLSNHTLLSYEQLPDNYSFQFSSSQTMPIT